MSCKFVLDSYAFMEYVNGTSMGQIVREALINGTCVTPSIVIAELSNKFHRSGRDDEWEPLLKFISAKTHVMPLDKQLASKSGKQKVALRQRVKSIGLADAIIYQTAIEAGGNLVSGDEHFEAFYDVIYLKRPDEALEKIRNLLATSD
ncbi:MAG TPA: PIN domain-containing protein [Candidatus Lokiarchaeia archaeon]|nr:PIN domain-containing protein [Candidatus Lokiarchaeia archaeon]